MSIRHFSFVFLVTPPPKKNDATQTRLKVNLGRFFLIGGAFEVSTPCTWMAFFIRALELLPSKHEPRTELYAVVCLRWWSWIS